MGRLAFVKRSDQGLLDRGRAVERPEVAPRFQAVGFWDVPVAEPGGLVVVEAQMNSQLGLLGCQQPGEIEVGRRVKGRVASQDQQRLDGAGLDISGQIAERADLVGRACVGSREELNRFTDVAQGVIDQVGERMNLGRLGFAGDDQALTPVRLQVACQCLDPAGMLGDRLVIWHDLVARPGRRALSGGDGSGEQRQHLAPGSPGDGRRRPR